MTMKEVVNKLRDLLEAANTTYLATAAPVVRGDVVRTRQETGDETVTIEVIPLPSEMRSEQIGPPEDLFKCHIRARYPANWDATDKQLDLCEEIKQVICDNMAFLNSGGEEAHIKSRTYGYGYTAQGDQTMNTVDVIVEYQGPGPTPSA